MDNSKRCGELISLLQPICSPTKLSTGYVSNILYLLSHYYYSKIDISLLQVFMNYKTIIAQFNSQGLAEQTLVTFEQLKQVLDRLIRANTQQSVPTFSHEIAEELWAECEMNVNGQIEIGQFAAMMMKAKEILEQRIEQTRATLRVKGGERQELERQIVQARSTGNAQLSDRLRQQLQDLELEISVLEEDYRNYDTDFKVITVPFNRIGNVSINGRATLSPQDAMQINGRLDNSRRMQSQFFMKRSNSTLTFMFYLSVFLLLVEIMLTVQKHHFLGILTALAILAIFALNFFNEAYIKVVLGLILTSVISDVMWLVLSFGQYWAPGSITTLPRLYPGLLRLVLLGVIIVSFIKVVLGLILLSYRNVQEEGSVNCCCCEINVIPQSGPFGMGDVNRPDSFFEPRMM